MRILVTGGAGFIGSAVVRHALATGHEVVVVDKMTYAASPLTLTGSRGTPGFQFEQADICDGPAMARVLARFRPDAVMNLAAESHVDRSIAAAGTFVQTNILGTFTMLQASLDHWIARGRPDGFRFHQVSTDEVFGSLGPRGQFRETSRYRPRSPYAATKAGADHLVGAWGVTYGLPILVTNCSNNYGPFQFPEKLIPVTILNALAGRPLPIYGDGTQVRDWLHVDDHAEALLRVVADGRPGRSYGIGGDAEATNISLVRRICARLDALRPAPVPYAGLIQHVADRRGHDRRYAIDGTRIRRELGWTPRRALADGLNETVQWYLDHAEWWGPLIERVDRETWKGAA